MQVLGGDQVDVRRSLPGQAQAAIPRPDSRRCGPPHPVRPKGCGQGVAVVIGHKQELLVHRQHPSGEGGKVAVQVQVPGTGHVQAGKSGVAAHVHHLHIRVLHPLGELRRPELLQGGQIGQQGRTVAVDVAATAEMVGAGGMSEVREWTKAALPSWSAGL